jgi:hypothetical protein
MKFIGEKSIHRLIKALGSIKFMRRLAVESNADEFAENLRDLTQYERYEDPENMRTIKINRLPVDVTIYDIIMEMAKLNWSITRVMVDSISQKSGYFAHLTFDLVKSAEEALDCGSLCFDGRECKVTKPFDSSPTRARRGFEYGCIIWSVDDDIDETILIARRHDTLSVNHAVSLMDEELRYMYQQLLMDDKGQQNLQVTVKVPEPKVRSEIHVVHSNKEKGSEGLTSRANRN